MITVYVDPERARANPLPQDGEEHFYESITLAIHMLRTAGVKGKVLIIASQQAIEEYQGRA